MKFKGLSAIILILAILFLASAVSAEDLNGTDIASADDDYCDLQVNESTKEFSANDFNVYVDCSSGDDSNDGMSQETSVKSFAKALELSGDNYTIHLANGNYNGAKNTRISLTKSLTIVGSDDTTFDGENVNYLFNVSDGVRVTFKNIKFVNAYKQTNYHAPSSMYGGALEINRATVLVDSCSFIKNRISYDTSANKFNYGGAISNFGDLTIVNSYFESNFVASTSGLYSYGGSIYNRGKLLINSTRFYNATTDVFGYGGAIYNDGDVVMDKSVIANSFSSQESKGSAIFNAGNFTLTNSIIENNTISRASFYYIYGAIYNYGNMVGHGNIFKNNTGIYEAPNPEYRGSPTIYNVGDINMTYCIFVDNAPFNGIASDIYLNGGRVAYLEDNWWSTNDDPYTKNKINVAEKANSWFILNLIPEYSPISIGQNVDITAYWSLSSTLTPKISLLPILNITFTTQNISVTKPLIDGQCTFNFNCSQIKGLYEVTASMGEFNETVLVDVGKITSYIDINITDNVLYTDSVILTVDVTGQDGNVPQGNVSVIVDKTLYTVNLTNGKGFLNLSGLNPDRYVFKIVYEGNDDYFKAFAYANVTVNKAPTNLSVIFPDIFVDQKGVATITLAPQGVQGQGILYINGVRKKIVYLYNGNTTVPVSNFEEGEYNVTVEFMGTKYYEASSASTTFRVSRYDSSLNVTAGDISVGDDAVISVRVSPSDLRGEAILNINGVNRTIFLDYEVTNITISNLSYGEYDVWVYYPQNQKYHAYNASASFRVLRTLTELDVKITEDGFNGTVTVRTNYTGCTGSIGVYINYRLYYSELVRGVAKFNVTFDKGTNYIYVFYDGDKDYEASTWNTTIGVAEEFILVGMNSTSYEHNDFRYAVHLIETNGIPMPNRIVSVLFNGTVCNITTDDEGTAYLLLNLNAGEYEISAAYKNQTVTNTLTVKEIRFNVTVQNVSYAENANVRVEFENDVEGNVNLFIDGFLNRNLTISNGTVSFNVSGLNVGSYEVGAKYFNDYFTSGEVTASFEVSKADPVQIADIHDVVYGENSTLSVVILNSATGKVTFVVDGVSHTVELVNGSASIVLADLDKATHNVTIIYSGDSNYNNATLNSTFNVKDAYSDIVLLVNDSRYGESVTVTAVLNQTATGNVTFAAGRLSKEVKIINGTANWTFSGSDAGNYTLTAKYPGDSTFISSANSTSFNVLKANSTLELFVDDVNLGENILIYAIVSENATGKVSFSIPNYYSPRAKAISNSVAVWYISPLNTGRYSIIATYDGDNNYCASNDTYILDITQRKSVLKLSIADAGINDRVTARASLQSADGELINGTVVLTIGSKPYNVRISNGVGNLVIGKMAVGNYSFSAVYAGNENFSKASFSGKFKVVEGLLNLTLSANNVTCYYGADRNFTVSVRDDNKNPISGIDLTVKIDGVTYDRTTDTNGEISVPIKLGTGKYGVKVNFNGNSRYNPASLSASVEVLSTVEGIDVTSLYNTTAQYFAIFCDSNGKALGNAQVTFKIGKNSYTAKTLPNGISRVNINFSPGKYEITAINPATGQKATNSIFIFLRLMENKDITKYYGDSQVYKVRAYDNNGNPAAGKTVTFKVNGKTYKVKTDKNGYAKVKLNLKPKTYKITASFNGFKVSNKIKVKNVLSLSGSVKKNKIKFKSKLVSSKGKALKGKKITFKFKGKTYKKKTNSKGIATLKLKMKLTAGKYKIKVKYKKASLTKTVKIKK